MKKYLLSIVSIDMPDIEMSISNILFDSFESAKESVDTDMTNWCKGYEWTDLLEHDSASVVETEIFIEEYTYKTEDGITKLFYKVAPIEV